MRGRALRWQLPHSACPASDRLEGNSHAEPGYRNPSEFPFRAHRVQASSASVGAFRLGAREIGALNPAEEVPLTPHTLEQMHDAIQEGADVEQQDAGMLPAPKRRTKKRARRGGRDDSAAVVPYQEHGLQVAGNRLYSGSITVPRVGDVRIRYRAASPAFISVVARQRGSRFVQFQTQSGDALHMVEDGSVDAATMFARAQFANTVRPARRDRAPPSASNALARRPTRLEDAHVAPPRRRLPAPLLRDHDAALPNLGRASHRPHL